MGVRLMVARLYKAVNGSYIVGLWVMYPVLMEPLIELSIITVEMSFVYENVWLMDAAES